jgi:hypothetical protein
MERTIVLVTPAADGWRVQCEDDIYEGLREMRAALWTGCTVARDLYRATGCPTAVQVRIGFGDGVMMDYHG